jgi:hypothetical protein
MKKTIVAITLLLFLIGVFSVTISINDFFFTSKFYDEPLSAYNANAMYDVVYGETEASREIGLFEIGKEKALFIGELANNCFLVAEMNVKKGKFAHEGTVVFFDYNDEFNVNEFYITETKSESVKWTVACDNEHIKKLSNVKLVKEYMLLDGCPLFFVVFE